MPALALLSELTRVEGHGWRAADDRKNADGIERIRVFLLIRDAEGEPRMSGKARIKIEGHRRVSGNPRLRVAPTPLMIGIGGMV